MGHRETTREYVCEISRGISWCVRESPLARPRGNRRCGADVVAVAEPPQGRGELHGGMHEANIGHM